MSYLFLLVLFYSQVSISASVLEVNDVLKSTDIHHPLILKSLDSIRVAEANLQKAKGGFDLTLKSYTDNRLKGYYDGNFFDVLLEKPFLFLNSKLYLGYRKSENFYPEYEGKYETLSQGEQRVGLEISLWRDRRINDKSIKIFNSKLKRDISKQDNKLKRNEIRKYATKAYWNWYSVGHNLRIKEELLKVAELRQKGITQKVKRGDLAQIYQVENRQYIMKRKADVIKQKQSFLESSMVLSLFFRDNKGKPLVVSSKYLSKDLRLDYIEKVESKVSKKIKTKENPKLLNIDLKIEQLLNKKLNAENDLHAKVNLKFEVSKDTGNGEKVLVEENQRVMLSVEIPIERNLGNGNVRGFKNQITRLKRTKDYELEKLNLKIRQIKTRLQTYKSLIETTNQEYKLAQILEKAEQNKIKRGVSDFFILNIREQNTANAKIKLINSYSDLTKTVADYYELVF